MSHNPLSEILRNPNVQFKQSSTAYNLQTKDTTIMKFVSSHEQSVLKLLACKEIYRKCHLCSGFGLNAQVCQECYRISAQSIFIRRIIL